MLCVTRRRSTEDNARRRFAAVSAAVAVRGQHQLLGNGGAWWRRRVGADRDGLGDAAGHVVLAVPRGDGDALLVGALDLPLQPRVQPGVLQVVQKLLGLVLKAQ